MRSDCPTAPGIDEESVSIPEPIETPEQTIARLERELAQSRALVAAQQTIIRAQRRELDDKTAYITRVTDVLAKPNAEMSASTKIVALALTYETHYRADRGRANLPLAVLAQRTGLSKNTVSAASRELAEHEDSPFDRAVTREFTRDEDGVPRWQTTIEFRPRLDRTEDTMRAVATLPARPGKPKHGGSPQAAEARWRRCGRHQDAGVVVKGYCSTCGKVLGERVVSPEDFERLNHQVCDSGQSTPRVDDPVLNTGQVWDSAGLAGQAHQLGDSAVRPLSLLDYAASQAQGPPSRCSAPNCRAMEFRQHPDGSWRCAKSGHDPRVYELAAVSGGSE